MTLDPLYAAWRRLGVGVNVAPAATTVWPEDLLAHTFATARDDARLFLLAASWARLHGDLVDTRLLGRRVRELDPDSRAVAGLFVDVIVQGGAAMRHWAPVRRAARRRPGTRPLFRRAEHNPALLALLQEDAAPEGRRWGWVVSQEDLVFKDDAIVPRAAMLEQVPELRCRALLGTGLDARLLVAATEAPRSIRALSRIVGATYAGTHRAVQSLVQRGLLTTARDELARYVHASSFTRRWLLARPADGHVPG